MLLYIAYMDPMGISIHRTSTSKYVKGKRLVDVPKSIPSVSPMIFPRIEAMCLTNLFYSWLYFQEFTFLVCPYSFSNIVFLMYHCQKLDDVKMYSQNIGG